MFPLLLKYGSLTIPAHGACVALGLVLGLMLALRTAQRLELDGLAVWDLGFIAIVGYIVGGRVVLFVTHWRELAQYPALILVVNGHSPAVLWGGCGVALAACALSLWHHPLPIRRTMDALAAPVALASALASVGAFAAGADYGSASNVPWAVRFHSRYALMWSGTPLNVPLHPVQLYGAAAELLICGVLLVLLARRHADGEVFGGWLALSGVARFVLEFYRGERGVEFFGGFLDGRQLLALVMIAAGGILWMRPVARGNASHAV
jgi:phosphatidylglycerol:prolipoprotein diacylglycerol transferase